LAVPPPPHDCGETQAPQSGVSPPQPSATCPQLAFAWAHVSGTQTVAHVPFLHAWFGPHWPQSGVSPPHPSATWPQAAPRSAHVLGVQLSEPH
jgi:hypothetical protein